MPTLIDQIPIATQDDLAFVQGEMVTLRAYELIVWVSLSVKHVADQGQAPRFPAILDTGHTHNFSIREEHLIRWAGIRPEMLHLLGHIRQEGHRLPLLGADAWIHRNHRGKRDDLLDSPPHRLILSRGIAVYPEASAFPRLPLLGLRSIVSNKLRLRVDGDQGNASLRTARPRWWPFA